MKLITALFLAAVLLLSLCAACGAKGTWQEQYDLGMRYLNDGNYKEAIIAFTSAIEIDPKRPEAYLAAAEAYRGTGDIDAAKEILEKGVNNCDDTEELLEQLVNIESEPGPKNHPLLASGDGGGLITIDELTFFGHSIDGLDLDTARALAEQNGLQVQKVGDVDTDIKIGIAGRDLDRDFAFYMSYIPASEGKPYAYYGISDNQGLPIGIRDIKTGDSLADVLTKLGFTNGQAISDYVYSMPDWSSAYDEYGREVINGLSYKQMYFWGSRSYFWILWDFDFNETEQDFSRALRFYFSENDDHLTRYTLTIDDHIGNT